MKSKKTLRELVETIQVLSKLSQEQVAEKLGYSRSYLSDAINKGGSDKLYRKVELTFSKLLEKQTVNENGVAPDLDENLHLSVAINVLIEDYSLRMEKLFPKEDAVQIRKELAQRTEMGIIQLMKK